MTVLPNETVHLNGEELLRTEGGRVDALESIDEEDTPLLRAAIAGHALVTRELLDAGSDPDWARESNGETALHVACFEGHAAVVEELARRSTSIDVRKTTTSETALYIACSKGHLDAVKALLKEGVQTDEELNTVPRTGYYPLYIAASNGHAEVVQELQESGCSISTLTTNKDTPLIIAGASECRSASCRARCLNLSLAQRTTATPR